MSPHLTDIEKKRIGWRENTRSYYSRKKKKNYVYIKMLVPFELNLYLKEEINRIVKEYLRQKNNI